MIHPTHGSATEEITTRRHDDIHMNTTTEIHGMAYTHRDRHTSNSINLNMAGQQQNRRDLLVGHERGAAVHHQI